MTYTKNPTWVDGEFGGTRVDAADLNHLEDGLFNAAATADAARNRAPLMLLDYAVGNGTADDTAGVQAAFDAATAANRPLYSPPAATYLCGPLTAAAMTLDGEFTFEAKDVDQPVMLTLTAEQNWSSAVVHCFGFHKPLYGIRGSGVGRSRFKVLDLHQCQIWGMQFEATGNNNMTHTDKFVGDQCGQMSAQTLTETAQTGNVGYSLNGYGSFTLSIPLAAKFIGADIAYFIVAGGAAYKIRTLTTTTIEVFNLTAPGGVGDVVAANIYLGGGLNWTAAGDNGVSSYGELRLSNTYGIAVHQASQYGHTYTNLVAEVAGIGFACSNWSLATMFIRPYFESCDVDFVSFRYVEGVMVAPQIDRTKIQNCDRRLVDGRGIGDPNMLVLENRTYGLSGILPPYNNPGNSRTLIPGMSYGYSYSDDHAETFVIDNDPTYPDVFGAHFIMVDLAHTSSQIVGSLSISLLTSNGQTIMGNAFGTPYTATVTGSTVLKLVKVGVDWKVLLLRHDVGAAVTATPIRLGQIAIVAGVGYLATGVASSADWKQITN